MPGRAIGIAGVAPIVPALANLIGPSREMERSTRAPEPSKVRMMRPRRDYMAPRACAERGCGEPIAAWPVE